MREPVNGTQGYAEEAPALRERYEAIPFETVHARILAFIPPAPARILDIGSGTGRDAAALAEMGHNVVAVEPTPALRAIAQELHPSPRITWLDDSLPELTAVRARGVRFDFVAMTAVWMHLDAEQRASAMPHVAALVDAHGKLAMTMRHGPVPEGRRMFEVDAEETIALAAMEGLKPVLNIHEPSKGEPNRSLGITWTRMVFAR